MDTTKVVAAVAAGFVAYCFYFDHKRRSNPDFQKNLVQKREDEKQQKIAAMKKAAAAMGGRGAPPKGGAQPGQTVITSDKLQKVFMEQLQVGQMLVERGEFDEAAKKLATALHLSVIYRGALPQKPEMLLALYGQQFGEELVNKIKLHFHLMQQNQAATKAQGAPGPK